MKAPNSVKKAGHSAKSQKPAELLRNHLPACSGLGCCLPVEWGAANNAIELAARSLEGIMVFEVKEFDMKAEKGTV